MNILDIKPNSNFPHQPSLLLNLMKAQHTKCGISSKEISNQKETSPYSQSTFDQSISTISDMSPKAQIPSDYLNDIWSYLLSIEHEQDYSYSWLQNQLDINDKMRYILIDWIINIHYQLSLKQYTLYLTINIIDRFISKKQILRTHFQLLGIGALFVACKYEEISCPKSTMFIDLTNRTYSKSELMNMELDILSTLSFSLTLPSSLNFFEIIAIMFNFNNSEVLFGNYLLEAFLCDSRVTKYLPSVSALAVAYIIMKMANNTNYIQLSELIDNNNKGNSNSKSNIDISYKIMKICAHDIYSYLEKDRVNSTAVYNKYSSDSFKKIAITGIILNN